MNTSTHNASYHANENEVDISRPASHRLDNDNIGQNLSQASFAHTDRSQTSWSQKDVSQTGLSQKTETETETNPSQATINVKDANLVTWDSPSENPKNWTAPRKWMATLTVSLFCFISPVSSSMIAPALQQLAEDFGISNRLVASMAMSIFMLGFALGPLFLGPLSELGIFGRRLVLQLSMAFYLVFNLAAGFSNNTAQIIVFRFLSGLGGSAPPSIGGGVLADIWAPTERGRAMALFSLAPLLGPAVGPIAGAFIAEYSTWRWVFWSTTIVAGAIQAAGVFFLQETYPAAILHKKKKALMKLTGNTSLYTEYDNLSFTSHIGTAFKRPFVLLGTQLIVQVLSVYILFVYGVLFLLLTSFPLVWTQQYNQRISIAGLNYLSIGIGCYAATQVAALTADKIYKKLQAKNGGTGRPEFRVPLMFIGSIMVPAGLLLYGWTAQYQVQWIVPNIGAAFFAAGNQLVYQTCQMYIVDSYTKFAASGIAATSVLRSLGGFAFPLFADQMYEALNYGWGNTVLALIGVVIGLPAPLLLWWYGQKLREKSTYAAG